jgi:hypothetical protein
MFPEFSAAWILYIATVKAEMTKTESASIRLVFNDVAKKLNWLGDPDVAKFGALQSASSSRLYVFHILLFDS